MEPPNNGHPWGALCRVVLFCFVWSVYTTVDCSLFGGFSSFVVSFSPYKNYLEEITVDRRGPEPQVQQGVTIVELEEVDNNQAHQESSHVR